MQVAVIGGGVIGLGCALKIKKKFPEFSVTIITKDTTPNTTGDGSAGLWGPYLLGGTPSEKIVKWSEETHNFFYSLWREGIAGSCMLPCLRINKDNTDLPQWKNIVFGFKNLEGKELKNWRSILSTDIKSAHSYVTFTCEPSLLLKYLMDQFLTMNGKIIKREISNINDLKMSYDVIINCTGLNAKTVVPDNTMYPIRGQVARIKSSSIFHVILDDSDDGNYIIPNINTCVLGGTHQVNDYDLNIRLADSKFIREGCEILIPGLKCYDNYFEWVGLRPGRNSVRLEQELSNKNIIIHNYGHGGSGVTLFWGCATEVVNILENIIKNKRSKL